MRDDILNKIVRKKILWAEIKVKENEFKRIQNQIRELEKSKEMIIQEVQLKLQESQDISEYLDGLAYESNKKQS